MIELIENGGVTSAKGFLAGATYAGIKMPEDGVLDLAVLASEIPAQTAGTFTTSKIVSPSVVLSRQRVENGIAHAVVVNSGCANCCVGEQGLQDADEMTSLAAKHIGLKTNKEVLVCSTGVIGVELPMALVRQNMSNIRLDRNGNNDFARAIMTTDSRPKQVAVTVDVDGTKVTVGAAAKGVGMIHPNMATMLCFITTDAMVENRFLNQILKESVDSTFNMIDVDGDQSTNDTVLLLANGASGGAEINANTPSKESFVEALVYVCTTLAKDLVRDGEGAQRLIEVCFNGAKTLAEARKGARKIAGSLLVKAMVHGRDPNWGRVMMAIGKSGIDVDESQVDLYINDIHIVHKGVSFPYMKDAVINAMSAPEVQVRVDINAGDQNATAWGCDLTEEYVIFNSAYST